MKWTPVYPIKDPRDHYNRRLHIPRILDILNSILISSTTKWLDQICNSTFLVKLSQCTHDFIPWLIHIVQMSLTWTTLRREKQSALSLLPYPPPLQRWPPSWCNRNTPWKNPVTNLLGCNLCLNCIKKINRQTVRSVQMCSNELQQNVAIQALKDKDTIFDMTLWSEGVICLQPSERESRMEVSRFQSRNELYCCYSYTYRPIPSYTYRYRYSWLVQWFPPVRRGRRGSRTLVCTDACLGYIVLYVEEDFHPRLSFCRWFVDTREHFDSAYSFEFLVSVIEFFRSHTAS